MKSAAPAWPACSSAGIGLAALLVALAGPARADSEAASEVRSAVVALASPSPEKRRAALERLAGLAATAPPIAARAAGALEEVVRRRDVEEGARAVEVLAMLPGQDARRRWLDSLRVERVPEVFLAALRATGCKAGDLDAERDLIERTRDERAWVEDRALALEALGHVGGPASRIRLLAPAPSDEDWRLASARALGLAALAAKGPGEAADRSEILQALLALLGHEDLAVRVHAWEALVRTTGERALGPDAAAWQAWLAAHPSGRDVPASQPEDGAGSEDRYGEVPPAHVPHYYGIPIPRPRSHVVFCLDVSQSMYGRGIEQARSELTRTLHELPSTCAFDVIAFHERVRPLFGGLVAAHPVVKSLAIARLNALETISYTNLYDAVELAFGYGGIGEAARPRPERLDAIFLLSDGAPNRGRYRREDQVVREIGALSRGRIPVHCVAAGEEVFPLLRRIADATGGRFVDAFDFE